MKKTLYLFSLILMFSCSSTKELVYYQVTFETGNIKPNKILLKPLYQNEDNQCGALFLDGNNLTVINNFDSSQVFINLKYKYEKNATGLYDIYTFEDIFLKKKQGYTIMSSLSEGVPILELIAGKVKVLDKNIEVIEKEDGSTVYLYKGKDAKGNEFTEIYTVRETVLSKVVYDKYSFPCE